MISKSSFYTDVNKKIESSTLVEIKIISKVYATDKRKKHKRM